jgi:tRNA dimethylallyltransferase
LDGSDETRPSVRVICGPTAAGKTHAATLCAGFGDVAVISADSRQVYRGFDVGTAKPTVQEQLVAPYYGIDVLEPAERASAAWWSREADGWIRDAQARGRTPVVVGGTGLYLRALFGELFEEPPMDAGRRAALQEALDQLSVAELRRWVEVLDPPRASLGRTQLLRAVEVSILTGRRVSDLHRERRTVPRWSARYLVVDPGPALHDRIATRTRLMFSAGWPEEVRALMDTVAETAPAWNASGYRAVRAMVQGTTSIEDAQERVIIETRQYAKRQRTWFRHQLAGAEVTRLDPRADTFERDLRRWWEGEGEGAAA